MNAGSPLPIVVRRARTADREAVLSFATRTWNGWDYIPEAWDGWLSAGDGVLLVATPALELAGDSAVDANGLPLEPDRPIAMTHLLMQSPTEAWLEGIRVDPRVRGRSVATHLQIAELAWARAQGARVIRYTTDETNEGSHRLGARHGLMVIAGWRRYSRHADVPATKEPIDPELLGAGLSGRGLLVRPDPGERERWWARVTADPTFICGGRLYERDTWDWQELTPGLFAEHVASGEVLGIEDRTGWGLAIAPSRDEMEEPAHPLMIRSLLGGPEPAIKLARALEELTGREVRLRLPDPDPPILRGRESWFCDLGYEPGDRALHILARSLEGPLPDAAGMVIYGEPPSPLTVPRTGRSASSGWMVRTE